MPDVAAVAQQLQEAFVARDVPAFAALLADDVRWGDDDHPRKCRGRADVVATFSGLMESGVDADITEMTIGPEGVLCRLQVRWPDAKDRRRGTRFYHAYLLRHGRISEIRRYDDRPSGLEAIGAEARQA